MDTQVAAIAPGDTTRVSLTAFREDISLREAALKLGFLTAEQFDSWVRPQGITHPLGGSL
jgi:fumarate hydratase class II